MIQNAVKMGRVFPTAYYGAYCYNSKSDDLKSEGVKTLIWAANKNCDLAMLYVGRFYKNGINGMYYDREIADSYFRISAALGNDSAKDEMKK
jgi:TPR repeat protein